MTIVEKAAYLKGLAEGLDLENEKSKEAKLINVMIGILEEIGLSIEDLEENDLDLGEEIDVLSDDLADVEDIVYGLDEEEDEDFDEDFFEVECPTCEEILERLNRALVAGVRVLDVYEEGRKIRDLALLRCRVWLEYDGGITEEQVEAIRQLFRRESLTVEKKGKNGPVEQDILPLIRSMEISVADGNTAVMEAVVCCQNPSLNPMLLASAVAIYLPGQAPDHCRCERIEIYDGTEAVFR